MSSWLRQPPHQRGTDVALTLQLAQTPALFEVAERSVPSRIAEALAHVGRDGLASSSSQPGIVLTLADLPEPPAPAAGQVLIGVEHAPIKMNDLCLIKVYIRVGLRCRASSEMKKWGDPWPLARASTARAVIRLMT